MLIQYIQAALENTRYKIINDEEPYYREALGLEGIWSSSNTFEKYRKNLEEVIDEWVIVRLAKGFPIPQIGSFTTFKKQKICQGSRLPEDIKMSQHSRNKRCYL